jgi:hypothetical protein
VRKCPIIALREQGHAIVDGQIGILNADLIAVQGEAHVFAGLPTAEAQIGLDPR